jgi:pectinesterase
MKKKIFLSMLMLILSLCIFFIPSSAYANTASTTVAKDGSGNYTTVQAALDSIPTNNTSRKIIYIKNGIYKEKVRVTKPFVSLIGQDKNNTIITYDDHVDISKPSSYNLETPTVIIKAKDFSAENINFTNTSGQIERANAVKVQADRASFYNCIFFGGQDTLLLNNSSQRAYFSKCNISGDVDFIYGAMIAAFDSCTINSNDKTGYITAASTPKEQKYGFLFVNCNLTSDSSVTTGGVYLGRPWRPDASVVYKNCTMDAHINLAGWDNWGNASNESTARYIEYGSSGAGWSDSKRVKWVKTLLAIEATNYTVNNYMKGEDSWDPTKKPY